MARRTLADILPTNPFSDSAPILRDQVVSLLGLTLMGETDKPSPEHAETERLRQLCREGNPFPLTAHQWPELIVTDPDEAPYFEGEIGNPLNPCLRLDDWQRQIIASFFDDLVSEIFIKGNTKAGKGTSTSIAVNLWFDVWRDTKIVLTSQRYEHAVDVIFGEISMWRARMSHPTPARLTSTGLSDTKQHYVTVANPKSGEGFSGQHGPRTLFVFDEATSVPDGFYNDAHKQARKIVALANPRTLFGWFRSGYKPCKDVNRTQLVNGEFGKRLCVTVDGANCMNVRHRRLESPKGPYGGIEIDGVTYAHNDPIPAEAWAKVRPLIPNQCDYGRFIGICQHADPRHVAVFAHGHFPTEDPEKQVILESWLEFHEAAWDRDKLPAAEAFGLDVARSLDGDSTCLTVGGKNGVTGIHKWKYNDTTYHVAEVLRIARDLYGIELRQKRHPVTVDMDGLGAGVGDQLKQAGVWVIEFRGNATSEVDPRTYANLRAEAYGTLGRRFNPDDRWKGVPWAIPPDEMLRQELCAPEKMYNKDPLRFTLTPKNRPPGHDDVVSVKDKIGRSPDTADSIVYLFHAVRLLHNLNEWFMQSQRPLVVFPEPNKPQALPPAPDPAKGEDPESPTTAFLRQQYGDLVGQDHQDPAKLKELRERLKEQQVQYSVAAPPAPAATEETASPTNDWLNRVKWSGGD
jgi:hypothetical protein